MKTTKMRISGSQGEFGVETWAPDMAGKNEISNLQKPFLKKNKK